MATKAKIEIETPDNQRDVVDGYIEGPLFVYKGTAGWQAGHVKTGYMISGKQIWKTKKEALAYAQRLIDYEGLNLEFDKASDFIKLNGVEFLQKVFDECKST